MIDTKLDEFGNNMIETLLPEKYNRREIGWHTSTYQWSLQFIPNNAVVLDIGCGIGYGSKIILTKASHWTGLDKYKSRKQRFMKDYNRKNTKFIVQSANKRLPFKDNSFDSVLLLGVIEHIEKDMFAVSEVHRVLKDGGTFCCLAPLKMGEYKFGSVFHLREYTIETFKKLIETSFKRIDYYYKGHRSFISSDISTMKPRYILCVAKKGKNENSLSSTQ